MVAAVEPPSPLEGCEGLAASGAGQALPPTSGLLLRRGRRRSRREGATRYDTCTAYVAMGIER